MALPTLFDIRNALAMVMNERTGKSIIVEGRIDGLSIDDNGVVHFIFDRLDDSNAEAQALLLHAENAIQRLQNVASVKAVATRHSSKSSPPPANLAQRRPANAHNNPLGLAIPPEGNTAPLAPDASTKKREQIAQTKLALNGVEHIIAVASGKGGVGKSTVTINLAAALARQGLRVGLLDADIYGPSLPILLGLDKKPTMRDGKIIPFDIRFTQDGKQVHRGLIRAMSIGFLVDSSKALAWRGPMVMGAVRQLINDVDWNVEGAGSDNQQPHAANPPLDVMLIDTPPGTGDAHLTLVQSGLLTGAVIVTTPQDLALADVTRGIALFEKTNIPILGLIENMAWLEMPDGSRTYVFGQNGGESMARKLSIDFLGTIPLDPAVGAACDAGAILQTPLQLDLYDPIATTIIKKARPAK